MIKRILALVVMAMLFSFNCEKGCGVAKKEGEMKETPAAENAGEATTEEAAPAAEEHK